MRYLRLLVLLTLPVWLSGFVCTRFLPADQRLDSWSEQQHIPILKGAEHNPIVKLGIAIPAGRREMHLRGLECSVDAAALPLVEKIELFLTAAEPFHARQKIGEMRPTSASFTIPVDQTLPSGLHFIWISVRLKADAAIDLPMSLVCETVLGEEGTPPLYVKQKTATKPHPLGVAIRKQWDDSVHTYRIPGLVATDKGTLIAVYDIRYKTDRDLPGNIDVGMNRSTDGGKTWEPMKVIMDMGAPHENNGVGDPAILFDPVSKKIIVAALWSKGNRSIAGSKPGLSPDTTGQFVLVESSDDGLSWSAPRSITPSVKDPAWHLFFNGPGSGIAMQDGTLVFAAQYWDENRMPYSTLIYSKDHGQTWVGNIKGPRANTTESQLLETTNGTLMLNMRDNRGRYRAVATTKDLGKTWTEHASSYNALPDPVCMASIIKAKARVKKETSDWVFFSNPNTSSGRYNISIKASPNLGESWPDEYVYLLDERASYGYSSLAMIDEKHVGILYEGIRDLYFVSVPVNFIIR
jgi:sialidase-1